MVKYPHEVSTITEGAHSLDCRAVVQHNLIVFLKQLIS